MEARKMASSVGSYFECKSCGATVVWAMSKNGKKYLAQPEEWRGDQTFAVRTFLPSHKCTPSVDYQEKRAAFEASILAEGRLVKGQEVVAVKGRKVAKGTTGIIFWVEIDNGFAYGDGSVTRVGFKDADGNAHFTAATNVIATNQMEAN
jgi:hypothetical protein